MFDLAKKLLAAGLSAAILILAPGPDASRAFADECARPAVAEQGAAIPELSGPALSVGELRPDRLQDGGPEAYTAALQNLQRLKLDLSKALEEAAPQDQAAIASALAAAEHTQAALTSIAGAAEQAHDPTLSSEAGATLDVQRRALGTAPAAPGVREALRRRLAALEDGLKDSSASDEDTEAAARAIFEGSSAQKGDAPTEAASRRTPSPHRPEPAQSPATAPQQYEMIPPAPSAFEAETAPSLRLSFESPRVLPLLAAAAAVSWIPVLGTMAAHEAGHFLAARALGVKVERVVLFNATRSLADVKGSVHYETNVSAPKDIAILLAGPASAFLNAGARLLTALEAHHFLRTALPAGTPEEVAAALTWAAAFVAAAGLAYTVTGFLPKPGSDLQLALARWRGRKDPTVSGAGIARSPEFDLRLFSGLRARAEECLYVATVLALGGLGAFAAHSFFGASAALPAALGALSYGMSRAGVRVLEDSRSEIVGGWQASHDQKYRVGPDGNIRDVRGHKYGEDRYEAMAPGRARPWERAVIAAVSFGLCVWLGSLSGSAAVLASSAACLLLFNLLK